MLSVIKNITAIVSKSLTRIKTKTWRKPKASIIVKDQTILHTYEKAKGQYNRKRSNHPAFVLVLIIDTYAVCCLLAQTMQMYSQTCLSRLQNTRGFCDEFRMTN